MKTLGTKEFRLFYTARFKKLISPHFIIHYKKSDKALVGYSVPKKQYAQAVARNRLKRVMKSWLKDVDLIGFEVNIVVSKSIILQDKVLLELKNELIQLLKQIK